MPEFCIESTAIFLPPDGHLQCSSFLVLYTWDCFTFQYKTQQGHIPLCDWLQRLCAHII